MSNGYFGIGIYRPKKEHNIGTLWRTAYIYGASFIFVIDGRFEKQSSDVLSTWSRIPMFRYDTFEEFKNSLPYGAQLVGVELTEDSTPVESFNHPVRGVYLLGAEDDGIPPEVMKQCHEIIELPGNHSLNVAVAGSIILYDRQIKMKDKLPDAEKIKAVKNRS